MTTTYTHILDLVNEAEPPADGKSTERTGHRRPHHIDGHISQFPADVQAVLQKVRETIRHAALEAKDCRTEAGQPAASASVALARKEQAAGE